MKILSALLLLSILAILVSCADKEEWRKRSIYQLLTDRFARNDGQQYNCDNLGKFHLIQGTTAVEDIVESSIT